MSRIMTAKFLAAGEGIHKYGKDGSIKVCVCVMYKCEYLYSNYVHRRTLKSNFRSSANAQIVNSKKLSPLKKSRDPQRNV